MSGFLGFITGFGNATEGLIGGFLVLNEAGRPTEFHCTAPVRPNRAQEILYGNTLEGFVCGEQVAPALIGRVKSDLSLVLTNDPNFLTAPLLLKYPLGLVFSHLKNDSRDNERYAIWDGSKDGLKKEALENANESPLENELNNEEREFDSTSCDGAVSSTGRSRFYESLRSLPVVPGVDYSLWKEANRGKNRFAFLKSCSLATGETLTFEEVVKRVEPFLKFIDSIEPFERIRLAIEEAQKSC